MLFVAVCICVSYVYSILLFCRKIEMVGFVSGFVSGMYWLLSPIPGPAGIVANTLGALASVAPNGFWLWQACTAGRYKDEKVFVIAGFAVLFVVIYLCLCGAVISITTQSFAFVGFLYYLYK